MSFSESNRLTADFLLRHVELTKDNKIHAWQYVVRTDFSFAGVERKEEIVELDFPSSLFLVTPPSLPSVMTAVCCRDSSLFVLLGSSPVLKRRREGWGPCFLLVIQLLLPVNFGKTLNLSFSTFQ